MEITLREYRQRLGISQRHAAELIGITHSQYWRWENNWRGTRISPLGLKAVQLLPRLIAQERQAETKERAAAEKTAPQLIKIML